MQLEIAPSPSKALVSGCGNKVLNASLRVFVELRMVVGKTHICLPCPSRLPRPNRLTRVASATFITGKNPLDESCISSRQVTQLPCGVNYVKNTSQIQSQTTLNAWWVCFVGAPSQEHITISLCVTPKLRLGLSGT